MIEIRSIVFGIEVGFKLYASIDIIIFIEAVKFVFRVLSGRRIVLAGFVSVHS